MCYKHIAFFVVSREDVELSVSAARAMRSPRRMLCDCVLLFYALCHFELYRNRVTTTF